jgi:CRP-like cAMP-binding protein
MEERGMTVKLSLATVPLFQFLPADELKALAAIGRVVEKNTGDVILMHGEPVPGIFLVGEGSVSVHAVKPERQIAELKVGESFGEMSYLENSRASATIRAAARATKLILFTHNDLRALIDKDPVIGRCLFQGIALQLSKKLRATTAKLARELSTESEWSREVKSEAGKEHGALGAQVAEFHRQVLAHLDQALAGLEELGKKITDKPGSMSELTLGLTDLRAKTKAFFPRVESQVASMVGALSRLAELVAAPHE